MAGKKKPTTVEVATELMLPVVEELGLQLWDVKFEKEGSQWYLRYFIDKSEGLTIQDCEQASRAVDEILDQQDPIPGQYILEVGSPGVERRLTQDWHFQQYIGHEIHVRFYRAFDNVKDFIGELISKEDEIITIQLDEENEMQFELKEAALVELVIDFGFGGSK